MNRTLAGVCTAVLMSAAILGAQSKPSDSAGKTSDDDNKSGAAAGTSAVTFTGCVAPRGTADSFYLTGAKQKGVKGAATTVKLLPATKKVDLEAFVAHEVEVTGTLDQAGTSAAPAGGSTAAPTLTVTKVKSRAEGC